MTTEAREPRRRSKRSKEPEVRVEVSAGDAPGASDDVLAAFRAAARAQLCPTPKAPAEPTNTGALIEPDADDPDAAEDPTLDLFADSGAVAPSTLPSGDVARSHLRGVIESLIFASDRPMAMAELVRATKANRVLVKEILVELVAAYRDRGFRLDEIAGGYAFRTSPAYAPFVRDLSEKRPVRMSRAQIETLAIVAYRQPITRPEIDDVRGVDSGPVLKALLERDLVRILGKKDEPGRPMLYGTTPQFLEFFGLRALADLPTLREFTELSDESRRTYERELGEDAPATAPQGLPGSEGSFNYVESDVDAAARVAADVLEAANEAREIAAETAVEASPEGETDPVREGDTVEGGSRAEVEGSSIEVEGKSVDVEGSSIEVEGKSVDVEGSSIEVEGSSVDVEGVVPEGAANEDEDDGEEEDEDDDEEDEEDEDDEDEDDDEDEEDDEDDSE